MILIIFRLLPLTPLFILIGCTASDGAFVRNIMPDIADALQTTGMDTNNEEMYQSGLALETFHDSLPEPDNTTTDENYEFEDASSDIPPTQAYTAAQTRMMLPSGMVENANCNSDYLFLSPLLAEYQDITLSNIRKQILTTSIQTDIQTAKSQGYTKEEALTALSQQTQQYDITATESANTAASTQAAGSAIDMALNNTLPLNFTCEGVHNSSVCAFIINRWGALATRVSENLFSQCW